MLAQDAPAAEPSSLPQYLFMVSIALLVVLYFTLVVNPGRREERNREERLKNLKKNDRVLTAGGIYGVVTNVQQDTQEVTIRVDENNNTRLRVTLGSIARVIEEPSAAEPEKESNK
jgi:preprotein translocase subunit YajC